MIERRSERRRGLSSQQRTILEILSEYPRSADVREDGRAFLGNLATTSNIVDALGEERTPSRYASVSRALTRLGARGYVTVYRGGDGGTGRGFRYALRAQKSGESVSSNVEMIHHRRSVLGAIHDARETLSIDMRCRYYLQRHGLHLRNRSGIWHAICPIERSSLYHTPDLEIMYAWALVRFA